MRASPQPYPEVRLEVSRSRVKVLIYSDLRPRLIGEREKVGFVLEGNSSENGASAISSQRAKLLVRERHMQKWPILPCLCETVEQSQPQARFAEAAGTNSVLQRRISSVRNGSEARRAFTKITQNFTPKLAQSCR